MRFVTPALSLGVLLAVTACAGNTTRPTDVGNMQLPAPTNTGAVLSTPPVGRDVGSMSAPTTGGVVAQTPSTLRSAPDTGSMALPNRAQGNATQ